MGTGSLFSVEADAKGLDQILEALGRKGDDLSPIMAVIAEDLVAAVSDMYDTTGHGQWPPLAESTIQARRGGPGQASFKPMLDTGRLAASTSAHHGPDFAEASTNVDYVRFHLDGGPVIPKRNPFEIPDEHFDEAADAILSYILDE